MEASSSIAAAQPIVELDEVVNAFDAGTRDSLRGVLTELGNGFAGRGAAFNSATAEAPELLGSARSVAEVLADPGTGLRAPRARGRRARCRRWPRSPRARQPRRLVGDHGDGARRDRRPSSAAAGRDPRHRARRHLVAADGAPGARGRRRAACADLRPGGEAAAHARRAASTARSTRARPRCARATALAERLGLSLDAAARARRGPRHAAARSSACSPRSTPLSPRSTSSPRSSCAATTSGCGRATRSSTVSEGDASGNWFRTLVVAGADETQASARRRRPSCTSTRTRTPARTASARRATSPTSRAAHRQRARRPGRPHGGRPAPP